MIEEWNMESQIVSTFVPWLCISTAWWWLHSNRNMSL